MPLNASVPLPAPIELNPPAALTALLESTVTADVLASFAPLPTTTAPLASAPVLLVTDPVDEGRFAAGTFPVLSSAA
jgi:hypothetical protein